jgi:DNA-binding response OmpR family regulator
MRVLVVEDEKKVAKFIRQGLEAEGFSVETAYDGEEGVQKALRKNFNLILMDIMLPKKDGFSAIKELREKQVDTPIICLTARDSIEDTVAGLDIDADNYLVKPFAFSELVARCNALIRRNATDPGAEIYLADLRLDPLLHKVWRDDLDIDLTATEYALMKYFMLNPNQVLSRPMIADNVWDCNVVSFTNIIDVYVNYLRNKVDRDFERKLIRTVRGQGYMLQTD